MKFRCIDEYLETLHRLYWADCFLEVSQALNDSGRPHSDVCILSSARLEPTACPQVFHLFTSQLPKMDKFDRGGIVAISDRESHSLLVASVTESKGVSSDFNVRFLRFPEPVFMHKLLCGIPDATVAVARPWLQTYVPVLKQISSLARAGELPFYDELVRCTPVKCTTDDSIRIRGVAEAMHLREQLDESQWNAMCQLFEKRLTLVVGPPGQYLGAQLNCRTPINNNNKNKNKNTLQLPILQEQGNRTLELVPRLHFFRLSREMIAAMATVRCLSCHTRTSRSTISFSASGISLLRTTAAWTQQSSLSCDLGAAQR